MHALRSLLSNNPKLEYDLQFANAHVRHLPGKEKAEPGEEGRTLDAAFRVDSQNKG